MKIRISTAARFTRVLIGIQIAIIIHCGLEADAWHWFMGLLNGAFIGVNFSTLAKLRRIAADTD